MFAGSAAQRYTAAVAFIVLWMACGWLLQLDANVYLVLGVPLTILFQWLIRRHSLRTLWVRGAAPLRFGWKGLLRSVGLTVIPLWELFSAVAEAEIIGVLFSLCSVAGAFAAAFALRQFERDSWRPLLLCLASCLGIDAVLWAVLLGSGMLDVGTVEGGWPSRITVGLYSLVQYLAVLFIMEEVSFRMLDAHLNEGPPNRCVLSAIGISSAWRLWHLPISGDLDWGTVLGLLLVHVPYGVCLSLFWRRSGNLWVPVLSHAVGDAIVFSG